MHLFKTLFLYVVVFLSVQSSFSQDEIVLDVTQIKQTVVSNGINLEGYHRKSGNEILHSKFNDMLNGLPSQMIRSGMPLKEWEPENDNAEAGEFDWAGFTENQSLENTFERLVELDSRGYDLWLSVWNVADWLVENPNDSYKRRINDFDEFIESVSAYLIKARDDYGVTVKYVSVNEPTIPTENGWGGYDIALSVEDQSEMIIKGGQRFAELGIETRWVVALHKVYASELAHAQAVYNNVDARPYIAGFDIHGYWWQSGHDTELRNFAAWAQTTGLPYWCGECDYDNQFWQRNDKQLWHTHAMETAKLLHKMVNVAEVVGTLLWYGNAPDNTHPYRYANKHFYSSFTPGTQVIVAESSSPYVLVTAGVQPGADRLVMILQNVSSRARDITLSGLKVDQLEWIESKEGAFYQTREAQTLSNGTLTLTLEPRSINSLSGTGVISEIKPEAVMTKGFVLNPNYPNPFNPSTQIRFQVDRSQFIELGIYNAAGQKVRTLFEGVRNAGPFRLMWDGSDEAGNSVPSGVYVLQLKGESGMQSQKMMLMK